ncbi:MAG: endonuclease V [Planctomycetaceae bacterium]|nr:endonuclease V [Planctomycetaceae bacterium]
MPSVPELHSWPQDPSEEKKLQERLAGLVDCSTSLPHVETVAAADVSYNLVDKRLYAAIVVVRAGTNEVVEQSGIVADATFPYVPGLLSFREAPPAIQAYAGLKERPNILLVDGQGIAHPRGFGLASHLGLWLDIPTIGCAKSWLYGEHDEPGTNRGDWSPMTTEGRVIGAALRTPNRIKPVYVSVGHRCDLSSALQIVLANTPRYRLPTPARLAHQHVNDLRRQGG